jgi:hypothetical protein
LIPEGAALRIVGDVHGDLRAFNAAASTDRTAPACSAACSN